MPGIRMSKRISCDVAGRRHAGYGIPAAAGKPVCARPERASGGQPGSRGGSREPRGLHPSSATTPSHGAGAFPLPAAWQKLICPSISHVACPYPSGPTRRNNCSQQELFTSLVGQPSGTFLRAICTCYACSRELRSRRSRYLQRHRLVQK